MRNFSDLYHQYAGDVYRFSLWLAADPMEADDITAETFARAWPRFGSIRMETLKGYLLKIARNVYLAKQRRSRRETALLDTYPDSDPSPEACAETSMDLRRVNIFLQSLSECDRTAFVLRVQYDLSYGEIARVLEVSEVSARVKVHRTRKKLLMQWMPDESIISNQGER